MSGPIKKMPGPIYDSVARCEAPSMLYDTVRNPNAPYIPPVASSNSKDTLQSTQQRLNREVFERFKNTGLNLPHESFVAVVQVGKYVFLAIMLPPYLCFYGIPRWLMANVMPQIFGVIKNESLRIGRFAQELVKRIPDIMKGALEQLIGDALKMIKQQNKNLWQYLFSHGQNLSKLIASPFIKLRDFTKELRHSFVMGSANFFTKIAKSIAKARDKVSNKGIEKFQKLVQVVSKYAQAFDRAVLTPVMTWISLPFIKAASATVAAGKKIANTISSVRKKLEKALQPIVKISKAVSNLVAKVSNQIIQQVVQPMVNWMLPHLKAAAELARRNLRKVAEPFAKTGNALKEKIENAISIVSQNIQNVFQFVPNIVSQAALWMWKLLPYANRQKTQEHRKESSAKKFGRFMKKCGKAFSGGVVTATAALYRKAIDGLSWSAGLFGRFLRWLKEQLLDLPKKVGRGFLRLAHFVLSLGRKTVYGMRLTIAWVWALTALGFMSIRAFLEEEDVE